MHQLTTSLVFLDPLGHLNDLWKFSLSNSTWVWMSGSNTTNEKGVYGSSNSPTNVPGARSGAVGWYDRFTKEMWLFGGYGYDSSGSAGTLK